MNIREAILRAADSIESAPVRYDFMSCDSPECGKPLCMMGWIGAHLGLSGTKSVYMDAVAATVGFDYHSLLDFWGELRDRNGEKFIGMVTDGLYPHEEISANAAKLLRLFAEHRFPTAAPITYPNWLAIASVQTVGDSVRDNGLDFAEGGYGER